MRPVSTRYTFRRSRRPYHPRLKPAPSSIDDTANRVLKIIAARQADGWTMEQINWPRYCRDDVVIQAVTDRLAQAKLDTPKSEETIP